MQVLIIGNAGYVGSVLVPFLARAQTDWSLTGYDTGLFAHCLVDSDPLPEVHLFQQLFGDLRNLREETLKNYDAVVMLGALSNDPMGDRYAHLTQDINCESTVRIASLARNSGVRKFVFASSCSVYGPGGDKPRNEDDTVMPLTAYARSKVAVERDLEELATRDFRVVALRFATACGFSPRFRSDLVLNDFVRAAVNDKVIKVLSDGTPWRPLIHVKDMALAIEWAIAEPELVPFIAVNTGSNSWNYQVHELATAVQHLVPDTTVEINSDAEPDRRSYRVDFSRFKDLAPNHQPAVDLNQAILEMAVSLQSAGRESPLDRDFYRRLPELQRLVAAGFLDQSLYWRRPTHEG